VADGDDDAGVTVNVAVPVAVPPGAVTDTGPEAAAAGTVAVIMDPDFTVNVAAARRTSPRWRR
jgi:hypothetical protein